MEVPLGFHFNPSETEVVDYLSKKVAGQSLPSNIIVERDLYGSNSPWEIFTDNDHWERVSGDKSKKFVYVFTSLKSKNGGTWVSRRAGCDSWDGVTGEKPVFHEDTGAKIANKEVFVFVSNNVKMKNAKVNYWTMHEYALDGLDPSKKNYVLCKITKDVSKDVKIVLPKKKKEKIPQKLTSVTSKSPCVPDDTCDNKKKTMVEVGVEKIVAYGQETNYYNNQEKATDQGNSCLTSLPSNHETQSYKFGSLDWVEMILMDDDFGGATANQLTIEESNCNPKHDFISLEDLEDHWYMPQRNNTNYCCEQEEDGDAFGMFTDEMLAILEKDANSYDKHKHVTIDDIDQNFNNICCKDDKDYNDVAYVQQLGKQTRLNDLADGEFHINGKRLQMEVGILY